MGPLPGERHSSSGMQQSISYGLLLVPRSPGRVSQHRDPWRAEMVDRVLSPAGLDHRLLYRDEGHPEQWKSKLISPSSQGHSCR